MWQPNDLLQEHSQASQACTNYSIQGHSFLPKAKIFETCNC